jgi:hypothetical protein
VSDDPVLQLLGDIATRLGRVEEKVDATHQQAKMTNGRVTKLEAVNIAVEAVRKDRARGVETVRNIRADALTQRRFAERWLDRAITLAVVAIGYGLAHL